MRAIFPDTDVREVGRGTMKRSSPSSSGLGEHRFRQVKPRGVRIGDGIRPPPEAPPLFRILEVVPFEGSARLSPGRGA